MQPAQSPSPEPPTASNPSVEPTSQAPQATSPPLPQGATAPASAANPAPAPVVSDAQLAVNGILTNPNGLRRTATPVTGFPVPQLGSSVWRNIPSAMKGRWQAKGGPKLWARLHHAGYASDLSTQALGIRTLIERFVNAPDVLVSTPIAEIPPTGRQSPPWHFLVSGVTQQACDRLVGIGMIATETITIFTLPFIETPPTHIGTLEKFSLGASERDIALVVKAVRTNLEANPHIAVFANNHTPNADETTVPRAYSSIRVETIQIQDTSSTQHTAWNVYCNDPPQMPIDTYFQWVGLIKGLNFPTEDFGSGRMRTIVRKDDRLRTIVDRQLHCAACKSTDHPLGLCPFPNLEGWLGPARATEDHGLQGLNIADAPLMRGRGRGRGNSRRAGGMRGRGRD